MDGEKIPPDTSGMNLNQAWDTLLTSGWHVKEVKLTLNPREKVDKIMALRVARQLITGPSAVALTLVYDYYAGSHP